MPKVLVTGGAGFIGSHTCRRFLEAGFEVVALDSFNIYVLPIQPWFLENTNYRFNELLKGAKIKRGSTLDRDDLRRTILEERPDVIVHFAALPLANVAVRQSEEAFQGILQGTTNLLEVLRDVDFVKRFVYISSSMVYGDFETVPVPEDATKDPKDIYGGMKLAGEILTKVYSRRYNIPFTVVRPSAVYGPTDNNRRVVQIFLERAFAGEPIQVVKGPDSVMDFTYVKDIAEGIYLAATTAAAEGEAFNITRGEGRHLMDVVELLRRTFPDLRVEERDDPASFRPRRGSLDVAKAAKVLGYKPRYSLEDGLAEYIEYTKRYNPSIGARNGRAAESTGGGSA